MISGSPGPGRSAGAGWRPVRNGLKLVQASGSAPDGSAVAFVALLLGVLQIGPLIVCSPILPTYLASGPKRIVGLMVPIPWDWLGPLPWA
jgi:hypothetical protein